MLNRKYSPLVLACLVSLAAATGCETEVDDKPAAEVGEAQVVEPAMVESTTVEVLEDQSKIEWVGAKVTGQHDGGFKSFDGTLSMVGDDPESVSFTIDMSSIWSDNERLTGHLKTPDFFDVENNPTATFESTSITRTEGEGGSNFEITGNLTMRGQTQSITFPATVDMSGDLIRATSQFTIDRQRWGVSYKGAPDNLIRDDVLLKIDLAFPKPGSETAPVLQSEPEADTDTSATAEPGIEI